MKEAQRETAIMQHILQDTHLESKMKDYIKNMVQTMNVPAISPAKERVTSPAAATHSSGQKDSAESKARRYTDVELRRIMEDVAMKERKRYEEGNKLLISKIEQLKKQNGDLTQELEKQKETTRILESVSTTPVRISPRKLRIVGGVAQEAD